ncbi:hypothetical protein LZ32DRAFT_74253 [Colletotrichum eremochloae]|nr:hypothetical protein LZ32DRAFT_74253 [Colletotrichum eremochloae]
MAAQTRRYGARRCGRVLPSRCPPPPSGLACAALWPFFGGRMAQGRVLNCSRAAYDDNQGGGTRQLGKRPGGGRRGDENCQGALRCRDGVRRCVLSNLQGKVRSIRVHPFTACQGAGPVKGGSVEGDTLEETRGGESTCAEASINRRYRETRKLGLFRRNPLVRPSAPENLVDDLHFGSASEPRGSGRGRRKGMTWQRNQPHPNLEKKKKQKKSEVAFDAEWKSHDVYADWIRHRVMTTFPPLGGCMCLGPMLGSSTVFEVCSNFMATANASKDDHGRIRTHCFLERACFLIPVPDNCPTIPHLWTNPRLRQAIIRGTGRG